MAIHTLAPKMRDRDLRQGAGALVELVKSIQGLQVVSRAPNGDNADYIAMTQLVEACVKKHLDYSNGRREGFLRALTDLLYCAGQGCTPNLDGYDPIGLTEHAFKAGR